MLDTKIDQSTCENNNSFINNGERSKLFIDNDSAVKFILETYKCILAQFCLLCNNPLKLQKRTASINGFILRCTNNKCRKIHPLLFGTVFASSRIKICDLLYIIYKWLKNSSPFDILIEIKYSKLTVIKKFLIFKGFAKI
jgi:hypothetical protein